MTASAGGSEQVSGSSAPISVAVTERVAAMRLGLSVDILRRDRRLGHLGIPYVKYGSGKRGRVRYDSADLDRFLEARKRRALPPVVAPQPPVQEAHVEQPDPTAVLPEPPVEPRAPEPYIAEPTVPRRLSPPQTMWEALAERVQAELAEEPFAVAGRSAPRRAPEATLAADRRPQRAGLPAAVLRPKPTGPAFLVIRRCGADRPGRE